METMNTQEPKRKKYVKTEAVAKHMELKATTIGSTALARPSPTSRRTARGCSIWTTMKTGCNRA